MMAGQKGYKMDFQKMTYQQLLGFLAYERYRANYRRECGMKPSGEDYHLGHLAECELSRRGLAIPYEFNLATHWTK